MISVITTTYIFVSHLVHAHRFMLHPPEVATICASCIIIGSAWSMDTIDQASTTTTCNCIAMTRLHYHQHRHHHEQQQQAQY